MPGPLRNFFIALVSVWAALAVAGIIYAQIQNIPAAVASPVIAAFLWEASFYLLPGFESMRRRLSETWSAPVLAAALASSAVVPYLAYSIPTGAFAVTAVLALFAFASGAAFWYVVLPRRAAVDAVFLVFVAGIVLSKVFSRIYRSPVPGLHLEILGQLMWTRVGALAVLCLRREEGIGFGFLPRWADWKTGALHYLYFLPVGFPLALAIGLLRFQPVPLVWWKALLLAVGTFLGMLWVVALSEEFFFRGLLQQWLGRWLRSARAGLILASLLFGLAHLPFRAFPNWRFALLAAIAGWFYGRAFAKAGTIRAAMVTHALVNTTARLLFS